MARGNTRTRRSSTKVLLTVGVILVAIIALVTTLVLVDAIHLPFFKKEAMASGEKSKDHGSDIPVPLSARNIEVFTIVQPLDVIDPQTKQVKVAWVDPAKAKNAGFFTQYTDVVGRVLKHDKSPGYAFTESDFYPKGASATPANGVEEGKRGLYVDPIKISGLSDLKRGDSFDLMGVVKTSGKDANGLNGGSVASSLVSGGKVILALHIGANGRPKPGELMYIQVSPQEFVDLQAALATGAQISCATRPGIPGDKVAPALPIQPRVPEAESIEILSGKNASRRQQVPSDEASNIDSTPDSSKPMQPSDAEPKKKGVLGEK